MKQENGGGGSDPGVEQKDNTATGGDGGTATGGNGGDVNSGNFVVGNGNAIALGGDAEGGNTPVSSGDATGGNGGNASANGGDAASGIAFVEQEGGQPSSWSCGCAGKPGPHSDGGVEQEHNTATGGNGGSPPVVMVVTPTAGTLRS